MNMNMDKNERKKATEHSKANEHYNKDEHGHGYGQRQDTDMGALTDMNIDMTMDTDTEQGHQNFAKSDIKIFVKFNKLVEMWVRFRSNFIIKNFGEFGLLARFNAPTSAIIPYIKQLAYCNHEFAAGAPQSKYKPKYLSLSR
jgi:hypothetical protein